MQKTQPIAGSTIDGWLAVSTEGFASMNAGRDPAHLVKELVQNSLDALSGCAGQIVLRCEPGQRRGTVTISCYDNGCGMSNLSDIRTVFYTSKTDSHLQRGRMGRGFKEMLCLGHRHQRRPAHRVWHRGRSPHHPPGHHRPNRQRHAGSNGNALGPGRYPGLGKILPHAAGAAGRAIQHQ